MDSEDVSTLQISQKYMKSWEICLIYKQIY